MQPQVPEPPPYFVDGFLKPFGVCEKTSRVLELTMFGWAASWALTSAATPEKPVKLLMHAFQKPIRASDAILVSSLVAVAAHLLIEAVWVPLAPSQKLAADDFASA